MKLDTMLEVLWAATVTDRVRSRFPSRGGIMLVSPPGQLKTSFLSVFENDRGVLGYSDLTTTNLVEARDSIASRKTNTILLYDFQKIYERRQDTAKNIEGSVRALMDEGFIRASFEKTSHNAIQQKARALVIAACTPAFYHRSLAGWEETGFARRCLFCVYSLKNPYLIHEAVLKEKPIDLRSGAVTMPVNLEIDMELTAADEALIERIMQKQRDNDVPLNLVKKILKVLRWRYTKHLKQKDRSHEVLKEFSECLGAHGADVEI